MTIAQYKLLREAFETHLWWALDQRFQNEEDEQIKLAEKLQEELIKRNMLVLFPAEKLNIPHKCFIVTIYSTVEELTYEKGAKMILEGLHGETFGMSITEL